MTDESKQLSLNIEQPQTDNGPVVCLGMTFKNDDERREYFRNELRKKLPELKKIEGFPIGDDEDIIALSDPPYYTACPNPWINDFIEEWERKNYLNMVENLKKIIIGSLLSPMLEMEEVTLFIWLIAIIQKLLTNLS